MELSELKLLQALPLEVKIMKSKARIEEWYRFYCKQVYVSFSGGKDSTVLLHLVRNLYPDVEAVFSDTGLEFPEIRDFVKTIDNVKWLKPKLGFKQVIEKYGYPVVSKEQSQYIYELRHLNKECITYQRRLNGNKWGRGKISKKWKFLIDAPFETSHLCCSVMKKRPIKKYEKETGNNGFIGTMAEESQMRTSVYCQQGCNAFDNKRPISTPLGFWTEKDIWEYINLYNLPYSKIYDMGYERTGCMFCMYGIGFDKGENRFQRMQKTHPKQYEYCMKDTDNGGLGLGYVLDYINVPYKDNLVVMKTSEGVKYQQYKII